MDNKPTLNGNKNALQPYLSPLAVWALSVGSAIGWGSMIVTNNTYLAQAGPLGSILGLLIGFVMMLMVANHYHYLANRHPGTGGLYNYVKYIFGYDRAFLVAWFLFLVYISIFWANATSIPLFARYFLNRAFSFGYMYTVFGYEVYFGEILITLAVIWLVGLLCIVSKKATARSMEVLALVFTIGITVCFVVAIFGFKKSGGTMEPAFIPDKNAFRQVTHIAFISPWAFIGFESVSHSAAEYHFKHKNMFKILLISLIVITALYIFVILLSITVYPEECSSWLDYISRLDEFEGIKGLPAFYAANHYLGKTGVYILMASLLALVLTSLIGMLRAVSRLCYAVAQDGILGERFAKLSKKQIPVNAILLVLIISLPIPFLGRTPIGWIVDTTTIGATIIYGFASAAVLKASKQDGKKKDRFISIICMGILVAFLTFLLFPELFSDYTIESETYALLTVWSLLGLFFFNRVIRNDRARKFGRAIIVWIALLVFIVLITLAWVERMNESREDKVIDQIQSHYYDDSNSVYQNMSDEEFLAQQRTDLHNADKASVVIIIALFGTSIGVLLANYVSMKNWEKKANEERDIARTIAYTDPLTGVKSKHAFNEQEVYIDLKIRERELENFGIIVCDVNGLKKINDTLGHKAGDEYIRKSCHMLCEYFKHSPVFRIGGDEFVVYVEGPDFEYRKDILTRINEKIESNIGSNEVVMSLGFSEYNPETDNTAHEIFVRADSLMYERKDQLKSMGAASRD
jgi:diguanylate cyclase (GGDEF)-like protein